MGSRRTCLVALLLFCFVLNRAVEAKEEEFEGFAEDGLEREELEAPFVAPVRARAQSSGGDGGLDVGVKGGGKVEVRSRRVDPLEFWDEDEFEGLPEEEEEAESGHLAAPVGLEETIIGSEKAKENVTRKRSAFSPYLEIAGVIFFLIYGAVFWVGRKENEKIALAWATEFAGTDGILEKNFSMIGFGDEPDAPSLVKEGMNNFKFYASGRRYCESLLATLVLKNRQDLLSQMLYLVFPGRDEITIHVNMNEDAMEPVAFALTHKKKAKDMQRDLKDLQQFATVLSPPTSRKWVSEDLSVISESRELAVDLLPEVLLDQVFGEKAFAAFAPYFISLHFSDQFPESKHKKVLQFTFVIPPLGNLSEMKRLIQLVPYFIDMVGRYKMSPAAKTKASSVREKIRAEEYKELSKQRQEALQKKKSEQQTPLSSKKEEKERLRQLKKSMPKVKMSRGH
ncbi:hypothetical protein M758_UG099700 [Ceratodon purpureus]|nr:hypothetical protein M758_UG099700 [Ceratodon purpureus]